MKFVFEPVKLPLRVSVLAETLMVRLPPTSVMAPVFCVRFAVPAKVSVAPLLIVMGLTIVALTEASNVEVADIVRVPAVPPLPPKAKVAEPAVRMPAERVVPPV